MIKGFSPFGYEGSLVTVEVDLRRGIPATDIVGLADGEVAGFRERVKTAITNSGFKFPQERVLISLSPADLRKEDNFFDLAVALGVLAEQEGFDAAKHDYGSVNFLVMGGLTPSGEVLPVRGVSAALQSAVAGGIEMAIVPANMEVEIPDGISVWKVATLKEAWDVLHDRKLENLAVCTAKRESLFESCEGDFSNDAKTIDSVEERGAVKFAMTVAAAGRHHMLAIHSPAKPVTSLLVKMPEILPKLRESEKQSVNRIFSLADANIDMQGDARPFRRPHQTASIEGMFGGGASVKPGEISLAHNGVLFLDEAAEFRSSVLQMLRVPLESGMITLSRAGRSTTYPANFQLVMTANPCPCGNYGVPDRVCLCSLHTVQNYWNKFSGPLLDRIPIRVTSWEYGDDISEEEMRLRIKTAVDMQMERQGCFNQDLKAQDIWDFCIDQLDTGAKAKYEAWGESHSLRKCDNVLKVARTVADLYGSEHISASAVELAIHYQQKPLGMQ